ncbi:hypothetical protein R6Q59_022257 [Mikania micrantha]
MADASSLGTRGKRARRVTVAEAQAQRRQQQQPRERDIRYSAPIAVLSPSTHHILHRGERPARDAPPRPPVRPRLTLRYLIQRLDAIEDNQRRIAAYFDIELAPRMPDPHLPSDPEDNTDTEPDEGADEDEDEE